MSYRVDLFLAKPQLSAEMSSRNAAWFDVSFFFDAESRLVKAASKTSL